MGIVLRRDRKQRDFIDLIIRMGVRRETDGIYFQLNKNPNVYYPR